jgi:hypothetical protein
VKETKYDVKEEDDPKLYNNKHPEFTINQGPSSFKKKIKKSKTIVMPKKYEKAKPKVYDTEDTKESEEDDEDEEEKPIKVPAIMQKLVHRSPPQLSAHSLNHLHPPISVAR